MGSQDRHTVAICNKALVLKECAASDVLGSVNGGANLFCSIVFALSCNADLMQTTRD